MRYVALILMAFVFISCGVDPEESQIGGSYVITDTKVYFIDTLTVESSTIQFDSLIVSNASRLLIGAYNDPIFGKVNSRTFMQLVNYDSYTIDSEAKYDSIALVLSYDSYFYNDTLQQQKFEVFEVLQDIKPDQDNFFYNTTHFNYNSTPIASKIFTPSINSTDSLTIKISDEFGQMLFDKIDDNEINEYQEFLDEYRGIMVSADEDYSGAVLGFTKNGYLRMYCSINDEIETVIQTIDFEINPVNTFNQTISDQSGTYFEHLSNQETTLPSTESDNTSFIQAGIGMVTRIALPHISSLNDIHGGDEGAGGVITDAKLKITLKKDSYSDNLHTRDALFAYIIDDKSNVITELSLDGENASLAILLDDNPEFGSKTFELNILPFIEFKLDETHEEYFLALRPYDFNYAVDRYVLNGDSASENERIKLELTYVVYNE